MKNLTKIQIFGGVFALILIAAGIYFTASLLSSGNENAETKTEFDKVAIVEKVQSQNKLQTISQIIQRDVDITLDLGEFKIFGLTILENQKTQTVAITGEVTAGIDLSKIQENDVVINQEAKTLKITLPEPQIFGVNIIEDKTRVLEEDATNLFNLKTSINADLRRKVNDTFQRQVIKQAKLSLTDAACQNNILTQANENGKENLENLFKSFEFEKIIIETKEALDCEFIEVS